MSSAPSPPFLLPLPEQRLNQIFMLEGKAFNTLLLSEKSVMQLIVVVKKEILRDYEANWHYAFIVFFSPPLSPV